MPRLLLFSISQRLFDCCNHPNSVISRNSKMGGKSSNYTKAKWHTPLSGRVISRNVKLDGYRQMLWGM